MNEAEIAGYMGWTGPGAYTDHLMKKIKRIVSETQRRERAVIIDSLRKQADLAADELDRRWALEMAAAVTARGQA